MKQSKIIVMILITLVLTNLISWKQNADLFAKIRDVDPTFVQEGVASWYGPGFQGRKTANGERFNTYEMTAAHKTLPFNTLVKVTNLENGNFTIVRINDRGPYVRGRIIDLSNSAKNELQMGGLAQVRIEIVNPEEQTEEKESEEDLAPVNLFEEQFPPTSKIFVEWNDSANDGEISDETLNEILNSQKVRIKVLTPDVEDANVQMYQDISNNHGFNYYDITKKIKFISGYTIEVASLTDKAKASEMIEKLESNNFKNIFLAEIVKGSSSNFNVYSGNYKTIAETKGDIVKLIDMDNNQKVRIVKIGN